MKTKLIAVTAAIILCGCATPELGTVIPMEGGIYQVDGLSSNKDEALKSALYTAEKTCSAQHKRHIIIGQKTQYKGVVSQDTNRAIDNIAQAVANSTGKWVPSLSNDGDYRVTLSFKCEV
jgi:hypothetical protein